MVPMAMRGSATWMRTGTWLSSGNRVRPSVRPRVFSGSLSLWTKRVRTDFKDVVFRSSRGRPAATPHALPRPPDRRNVSRAAGAGRPGRVGRQGMLPGPANHAGGGPANSWSTTLVPAVFSKSFTSSAVQCFSS
jgi:hypothetical protein